MATKLITQPCHHRSFLKLNAQQQLFVSHLLADLKFNATEAAKAAGYKQPSVAAIRLQKLRHVRRCIDFEVENRKTRLQKTADDVMNHLWTALFLDPQKVFEKVGNGTYRVRDLEEIPEPIRCCITKLKYKTKTATTDDGTVVLDAYFEVELMSKDLMQQLAMKHMCLLNEKGPTEFTSDNVAGLIASLLQQVEGRNNVVDGRVIENHSKGSTNGSQ